MKIFKETVGTNGAELTGYLLDQSAEYPNADVRPAVLVCPGGGYSVCSDREAEPIALAYAGAGYQAFVLRYTTSGESNIFPQALDDAKAALHYLRSNADKLHIVPNKIAAVGFSAGGHLAAALGTMSEEKPDALVLGYPVILRCWGYDFNKQMPSLDGKVTEETPPTFVFATADDRLVPVENSLAFMQALAEHHIHFESHIYLTGSHGLSLATPPVSGGSPGLVSEAVSAWFADSVKFLRAAMGGVPVAGAGDGNRLRPQLQYGLDCPAGKIVKDKAARAILEKHLPGLAEEVKQNCMSWSITLREMAQVDAKRLTPEVCSALQRDLAACNAAEEEKPC